MELLLLSKVPMLATDPEISQIPNDDIHQTVQKGEGQNGLLNFFLSLVGWRVEIEKNEGKWNLGAVTRYLHF